MLCEVFSRLSCSLSSSCRNFSVSFFGSSSWPWLKKKRQQKTTFLFDLLIFSCIIKNHKIYDCNKRVLRMMGKFSLYYDFRIFLFLLLCLFCLRFLRYCLENFYDTFFTPSSLWERKNWKAYFNNRKNCHDEHTKILF